jgi:hypothetical protein
MVELLILCMWLLILGALGAAVENTRAGHKLLRTIDRGMTKASESIAYFIIGKRK